MVNHICEPISPNRFASCRSPRAVQGGAKGPLFVLTVNQLNPNVIYHSFYRVSLERSANKGNTWSSVGLPWPPVLQTLWYPPVEVFGSTVTIGAASLRT